MASFAEGEREDDMGRFLFEELVDMEGNDDRLVDEAVEALSRTSSPVRTGHEKSSGEAVKGKKGKRTKRFGPAGSKMAMSLEDEIHDLEDTIQKNKELCKRLNDRAERIEIASSKAATSKAEARQRAAELSAKATALEEEEEMLEYKKFMRERLRGRFESMQVAADNAWKNRKGRGKSRDVAMLQAEAQL